MWLADKGLSVAIVGGGYTGAVVAFNLAQALSRDAVRIRIIEPRSLLGGGVAYSTPDAAHRINVPADRMSIASDAPSHFLDWINSNDAVGDDPRATTQDGRVFPRRLLFGTYVAAHLEPLLASGRIVHVRDVVTGIERRAGRFDLALSHRAALAADIVVLATSHPAPGLPGPLEHLAAAAEVVGDVYAGDGLRRIGPDERVLIVGNGLTAADAIASLESSGHRGPILALSRRGLRSRGHAPVHQEAHGDFTGMPARTALSLLRRVRREILVAAGGGNSWHAVFDALREQAPAIWSALGTSEQARLVRHLRAFWDVHRFRAAPQVREIADRRIADGSLTVVAGRLISARRSGSEIDIAYRPRGTAAAVHRSFDRVVVATGPDHGAVADSNPAIASLVRKGEVRADPLRLGLDVSANARAINADGREAPDLFVAGPLARGRVGELMGLPQVTRHAEHVADEIARIAAATARRAG